MDTVNAARVATLILFPVAIALLLKTMYHLWFAITGIREDKKFTAGVLGPFAFLFPALFEERAHPHLKRLGFWLPASIVIFIALFCFQEFVMSRQ